MVYLNISLHQVIGFRVKNTHNYIWDDYSTKQVVLKISSLEMKKIKLLSPLPQFRVWLRDWEFEFPHKVFCWTLVPILKTSCHALFFLENQIKNSVTTRTWTVCTTTTLSTSGPWSSLRLCLIPGARWTVTIFLKYWPNFQQCDVELKTFRIDSDFDLRTRTARNVRVNIDSYHTGATGGGFVFFEVCE